MDFNLYIYSYSGCAISSIYSIKIDAELLSLNENRKAIISFRKEYSTYKQNNTLLKVLSFLR
jgi:hypothetical protein